jgi:predicted CoA-binding protein
MKKTVVIGATDNPNRFAYKAANMLEMLGHEFVPVGIKKGQVLGKEIFNIRDTPQISEVHSITLYINPIRQQPWYEYILGLSPERIIFNPGTENPELRELAEARGIKTVYGCTLVMLSSGEF